MKYEIVFEFNSKNEVDFIKKSGDK